MKLRFYLVLLTNIVGLSTTSCTKEQISSSGPEGNNTGYGSPQTIKLIANNWQQGQNGSYIHTFYNILSLDSGNAVKVYLLTNGQEVPINHFIPFMGGQLSASYTTTDVKIVFNISGKLPFTFLNIKLVIE